MKSLGKVWHSEKTRGRSGGLARLRGAAFSCVAGLLLPGLVKAEVTHPPPDEVVSRFRFGPFFEYRATREGGTFWAVRPFYSKLRDPVSDTRVTDTVWPLGTFHRDREQAWWRLLLAYGSDDDVTREDAAWKWALFPFWFQGRTRTGEEYRALFPIHGHLPHVLLMDDIDFTLFPLYLDYEVNGVGREYYLWPLFSRTEKEDGVTRTAFFPFYGRTEKREERHLYAFWPFWTSAVYEGERNPGNAWMLFPLYGRVDRAKERQRLVLPPFFSYAETDAAERWRLPWPFYETVRTPTSRKRSYWPLYGDRQRNDEVTWWALWPLFERSELSAGKRREENVRFFPFYRGQTVSNDGTEISRYTRLWPLWESEREGDAARGRALALSPIRYSGGIERNWAPFWTLYERAARGDAVSHDFLWGLLKWRTGGAGLPAHAPRDAGTAGPTGRPTREHGGTGAGGDAGAAGGHE
jgi:hypothetical protein